MLNRLYIWMGRHILLCPLMCIILLTSVISCTTTKYIPVEKETIKTEYRDRLQRDSIYQHDSIYFAVKGDTIYNERWHTKYVDRLLRDTINLTDSIKVPVPYAVEKKLSKWQQLKVDYGGYAIVVILVMIAWLVYKKRNK